ncbi:transketolase [Streptosporangium saharense]|uniref:transketolase n=1 Tax=Streptosporangium saharense TaxID=1706840 RepID=UPI0036C76366
MERTLERSSQALLEAGEAPEEHGGRGQGPDPEHPLERIRGLSNQVRLVLLEMIHRAGSGHIGSSLSCADIVSVLKFDQMNWDAGRSRADSDVFVLSKGHAVPAWYAALVVDGDLDPGYVGTLRTLDSPLQGHPDRGRLDLVDVSTGALGQGLSISLGRAQAKRLKEQDSHVYCVLGDGEVQEGQIWEAVMYAGVRQISNVVVFVDHNRSQSDGLLDEVMPIHPLGDKFRSFLWHVQEIDGHSHPAIRDAVVNARRHTSQPSMIIAHTRKGHLGEGRVLLNGSHGGSLSEDEFDEAVGYLRAAM